MTSIWKFNSQEANERECENGIGDGGLLIFADTEDEGLNKLYEEWVKKPYIDGLPEFDNSDDEIQWDTYTKDEWKNKLRNVMEQSPTYAFLVEFPSKQILK